MITGDNLTNGIAVGALATPAWHDRMELLSSEAALVLPVLGAVWLTIQILRALINWSK